MTWRDREHTSGKQEKKILGKQTIGDTSEEVIILKLPSGDVFLTSSHLFYETTLQQTKPSETPMEKFYSASKYVNSAFLFHNFSLYFQWLVNYEHSKNNSSLLVPRFYTNLYPTLFFFSVAFVKFLNSAHTELRFLPALGKELGMFYSKKKSTRELKQRKNLYRSRKEYYSPVGLDAKACIAQQKQKQIQREKKKRHFPNTLNLFIPRVGPHLPTNATALVNKKQSFLLTQFFFSSPLPKGIIFDYYWQVNLLHSMIPYNRKQYLVTHSCLLLSCLTVFLHQYLRCFLLLAV